MQEDRSLQSGGITLALSLPPITLAQTGIPAAAVSAGSFPQQELPPEHVTL